MQGVICRGLFKAEALLCNGESSGIAVSREEMEALIPAPGSYGS